MKKNNSNNNEQLINLPSMKEYIYHLRKKGLTYEAIAKKVRLSTSNIFVKYKKYIEENGETQNDDNEEELLIYKLRKRGLTYREISLQTGKSETNARKKYLKVLNENNKKDLNLKEMVLKEKIYQLRKDGLILKNISTELGIPISKVERLYEEVLNEKEEIKLTSVDEKIYKLRIKGLSYQQMLEELANQGIVMSHNNLRIRCKKIFEIKQEKEPIVQRIATIKRTDKSLKIDEEIYYLREQGISFQEISQILTTKGNKMGKVCVYNRYNRVKKLTNQQLVKSIMNLIVTRKATIEQIKEMAEYYNVNLDELLNNTDEIEK